MPSFTIDIPTAAWPTVQDALLAKWDYREYIGRNENGDLIPNPESKADFLRRKIRETMTGWVKNQIADNAYDDSLENDPDPGIGVT